MAVQSGYQKVYRYPEGYPEWQAAGLPVERASVEALQTSDIAHFGPLKGYAMVWTLLGIFVGGMALNLTPCVYPIIPVTVSYFGGRSGHRKGSLVGHGICYVGGLSTANSAMGMIAAMTGSLMGAALQNPWVLSGAAALLAFFAASLFGFWEFRLPGVLTQAASKKYVGYFGSLFMGLTLGLVAAPCIGPFVLGLLTWVASMGNVALGLLVFFTLSLGLGVPQFFLALFSGQVNRLPRSGEWMLWVRKCMGWILLTMAARFARPILTEAFGTVLLASVVFGAGVHLGWIDRTRASFRAFAWVKAGAGVASMILVTLLLGSWIVRGSEVNWQSYSDELLDEATRSVQPVIIDFYAHWCTPCRELEEVTFRHPSVVEQANKGFVMIKVDLTTGSNGELRHLLETYEIKGVPTVVFLDEKGRERTELRVVDYLSPDQFLARMAALKEMPDMVSGGR